MRDKMVDWHRVFLAQIYNTQNVREILNRNVVERSPELRRKV